MIQSLDILKENIESKDSQISREKKFRTNLAEMWARLNKFSNPPTTRAALQIVWDDGRITSDVKEVLEWWHRDISNLFSGIRHNQDFAFDDSFYEQII